MSVYSRLKRPSFRWEGQFGVFAIIRIVKKTKVLSTRMNLLSEASKDFGHIYADTTTDGVPLYLSDFGPLQTKIFHPCNTRVRNVWFI